MNLEGTGSAHGDLMGALSQYPESSHTQLGQQQLSPPWASSRTELFSCTDVNVMVSL